MDKELLDAGYRAYTGEKMTFTSTPGSANTPVTACVEAQSCLI